MTKSSVHVYKRPFPILKTQGTIRTKEVHVQFGQPPPISTIPIIKMNFSYGKPSLKRILLKVLPLEFRDPLHLLEQFLKVMQILVFIFHFSIIKEMRKTIFLEKKKKEHSFFCFSI